MGEVFVLSRVRDAWRLGGLEAWKLEMSSDVGVMAAWSWMQEYDAVMEGRRNGIY